MHHPNAASTMRSRHHAGRRIARYAAQVNQTKAARAIDSVNSVVVRTIQGPRTESATAAARRHGVSSEPASFQRGNAIEHHRTTFQTFASLTASVAWKALNNGMIVSGSRRLVDFAVA